MEENSPLNGTETPDGAGEKFSSQKTGPGAIVGAIIIIILLALGAFYLWSARGNPADNPPPLILGNETADANASSDIASGLPPQQTSDDEAAINSDIQAMNIDQFNAQNDASLQTYGTATQ